MGSNPCPFCLGVTMADEQLLDYCAVTGEKQWFSTDEDGNSFVRYEQDVSKTLDHNKEAQADGFDKRSDVWHAAKIPNVILMEWAVKYGVKFWDSSHQDGVKKLLNHPDYRYLRVNHFII